MNLKNIINMLSEYGYVSAKSSTPQYKFLCNNSDSCFSTIVLVDDINYPQTTDSSIFFSIRESVENTFLLRGYKSVEVLFVIFTKNPFAYRQFAEEGIVFWIADINSKRIISYTDSDEKFDVIKHRLEDYLSNEGTSKLGGKSIFSHPIFSYPIFTIVFALINLCIFLYMDLFTNPLNKLTILGNYASEWGQVLNHNEFYRLLTSVFLHFDFSHLANNMISLLAIGYHLEPIMGHFKFMLLYLISGIGASLTSVLYHATENVPAISAGASGAVFGIFGAYAIYSLFDMMNRRNVSFSKIIVFSVLMLYNGMINESVDNAAHLGGIIFGSIIAFICCICSKNKI